LFQKKHRAIYRDTRQTETDLTGVLRHCSPATGSFEQACFIRMTFWEGKRRSERSGKGCLISMCVQVVAWNSSTHNHNSLHRSASKHLAHAFEAAVFMCGSNTVPSCNCWHAWLADNASCYTARMMMTEQLAERALGLRAVCSLANCCTLCEMQDTGSWKKVEQGQDHLDQPSGDMVC
jgi:hypothetical protein